MFEQISERYNLQINEQSKIITIEDLALNEQVQLSNFSKNTQTGDIKFDILDNNDLLGTATLIGVEMELKSNCSPCMLAAAIADTFTSLIEAVREHRRLTTCEIAMKACIEQGGIPSIKVTENGGCEVTKCDKSGD